jgi:hypothetical protein
MRFNFSDVRRAKRLARDLQRELGKLGHKVGLTTAQTLAAKLYGYASYVDLKACIGIGVPSAWDEEAPAPVVEARREYQVNALVQEGIGNTTAEAVIALLRPTGKRDQAASKSVPSTGGVERKSAKPQVNPLDALLDEIDGRHMVNGVLKAKAAEIESHISRAYKQKFERVVITVGRTPSEADVHYVSFLEKRRAATTNTFDEFWRYITKSAGVCLNVAARAEGRFSICDDGDDIELIVSCCDENGYKAMEVRFAEPRMPTLSDLDVDGRQELRDALRGRNGLHIVCSAFLSSSQPMMNALFGEIRQWYDLISLTRPAISRHLKPVKRGEKPTMFLLTERELRSDPHLPLRSIELGHQVIMGVDAMGIEEALLLLLAAGLNRHTVKRILRSVVVPTPGDVPVRWTANCFPAETLGDVNPDRVA